MSPKGRAQISRGVVRVVVAVGASFALTACASGIAGARSDADAALEVSVTNAIQNASDLPVESLSVDASGGIVRVTGSLVCPDCGGMRTPGGVQTIQQSLGAVVRAVPGVERVEFDLEYRP